MQAERLRKLISFVKATPFHPQWLLSRGLTNDWLISRAKGKVLDIGCADRSLESMLPEGCDYVSLDYPVTGGEMYGARPDIFGNASYLPFRSDSFDTVVLFEVLEHVAQPSITLREIARVLKPEGHLLLTIPFLYPVHDAPHDYQRYTRFGLDRITRKSGFDIERLRCGLGNAQTSGLILNLALAGMIVQALERKSPNILFIPFLLPIIPLINISAWALGLLLPDWPALTARYHMIAVKL